MKDQVNNNSTAIKVKNSVKKPKNQVLRMVIIIAAGLLVLAVLAALNTVDFDAIIAKLFTPEAVSSTTKKSIEFAPIDYKENIFEDTDYLAQNRYVRYTDGPLSTLIVDDNYEQYGDAVVLLHNYIQAVINGDPDALPALFTDDYKNNNKLPAKFTMQKLYDVEIEYYSVNILNEGETDQITRYEYIIRYNIMENNGTFRDDVGSDAAVPEIYEVLSYDNKGIVLINSITKITWVVG
jgi:hypothetical protein